MCSLMNYWVLNSCVAFLLCAIFCGILIPQILLVSLKRKLFDEPDSRKIHHQPVPRLGGFAFTPVIIFTVSLILGVYCLFGDFRLQQLMTDNGVTFAFAFCALLLLYITGLADDLVGVRYRAKFIIQILCSGLLIIGGLWIDDFHGALWVHEVSPWIGIPVTVIAVVYIINSINLIDGIDGLASGLSIAAFVVYGVTFGLIDKPMYAMIAFAAVGVLVPFFYYNVFGNPERGRKIFMGDTGSLTIGLLLAFLSLELIATSPAKVPTFGANPLILALSPLIIPCFDVTRVFLHRIRRHGNPFLPDKTHIHHKLLALGLPQRVAMVVIVFVALAFNVGNIMLSRYVEVNLLLFLDILIWTVGNIWLSNKIETYNKTK